MFMKKVSPMIKKQVKNIFAAWIAVILVSVSFCTLISCGNDVPNVPADSTADTAATESAVMTAASAAECVVIIGDSASRSVRESAIMLADGFRNLYGFEPSILTDKQSAGENYAAELIVGCTDRQAGAPWDPSEHRRDDYFAGIDADGGRLYLLGGSDDAVYSAVYDLVAYMMKQRGASFVFTSADTIEYVGSYSLESIISGGRELFGGSVSFSGDPAYAAAHNGVLSCVADVLAQRLSALGGYDFESSAEDGGDILITTAAAHPEYARLISGQNSGAVLTCVSGRAVLCAADDDTLLRAVADLCEKLGDIKTLNITEGNMAYEYTAADSIRAMSFNILGLENNMTQRMPAVEWVIVKSCPDIFGIQEGKAEWISYFASEFGGIYDTVGVGGGEERNANTFDNIYYRTDRFTLIEGKTIWLSDTPDVPASKFESSKRVRIATWAHLIDKRTGRDLLFVNTHLDNASKEARMQQTKVLLELLAGFECHKILCGDFNSSMTSDVYEKLTSELADSRTVAAARDTYPTYNRLGDGAGSVLDYIFLSRDIEILTYRVKTELYRGSIYPSDHNAIVAEFKIK